MRFSTTDLFDLAHSLAATLLSQKKYPWEALAELKEFIVRTGEELPIEKYEEVAEHVWVAKNANVARSAFLGAPLIIGERTEIRHCAYIRGSVLVGNNCVVGNSTELKNSILFDGVQVPHFNYVGDSILGHLAHLGAGTITSNVKSDKSSVTIRDKATGDNFETKLWKLGALVGDGVEIGCNCVLNPGTVVGRNASVYPLTSVRGVIPSNSIVKDAATIITKR